MSDELPNNEELGKFLLEREKYALEVRKQEFEEKKHEFEKLQFLHTAGLERWQDRRENEWKLNYAIWAAIAGLDALLLLHRDALYVSPWFTIPGIAVCVSVHCAYLLPTTERAISEIEMQCDAEIAVRALIADESIRNEIRIGHLGGAIRKFDADNPRSWFWKHYGVFAPAGVSMALLVLAVILLGTASTSKPNKRQSFQLVKAPSATATAVELAK